MTPAPWSAEWSAIRTQIEFLQSAGDLFLRTLRVRATDDYNVARSLLPQAKSVFDRVVEFRGAFADSLPTGAKDAIDQFLTSFRTYFGDQDGAGNFQQQFPFLQSRLVALAGLRAELTYQLTDTELEIRSAVERAFVHLQACIAADEVLRCRWQAAFDAGEPRCERLGAVHLLWHGIWAFKVDDTTYGRTDLVLGDQIDNPTVDRAAVGLVHTEWKRATATNQANTKWAEARRQAARYRAATLAGVQLRSPVYLVLVSESRVAALDDLVEEGVTYRHINVATAPDTPSAEARSPARATPTK